MDGTWSTRAFRTDAGLDSWRDAVGLAAGGIETRMPPSRPFYGKAASRTLGGFRFVRFKATGHVMTRSHDSAPCPGAHLLVSLQLDGEARLVQEDLHVAVDAGAGAVGLLDATRPFELSFPTDVERIFFFVPHTVLRARAPWLARARPTSFGRENPVAGVLRAYMLYLGDPGNTLDDRAALALLDGFVGALAIASAVQRSDGAERAEDRRSLGRVAICAHMRRRLGDPALSPATVARAFDMSPRSVHKLFEGSGASFSEWLLNERLEACAAALRSAEHHARIADTAFAAGFNDLSHFNRSFKARFEMTPRQWRRCAPSA